MGAQFVAFLKKKGKVPNVTKLITSGMVDEKLCKTLQEEFL